MLKKVSPWLLLISLCLHWSMKVFIPFFFLWSYVQQQWCFSLAISKWTLSLTNLLGIMLFFSKELIMHHVKTSISSQHSAFRQCGKFQSCSPGGVKKNKQLSPTHNVSMLLISYLKWPSFLKCHTSYTEIFLLSAFHFPAHEPVMQLLSRTGHNIPPEHKGIIIPAVLFLTPLHSAMFPFLVIILFWYDWHLSSNYLFIMAVCWLSLGSWFLLDILCLNDLYLKGHCTWTGGMPFGWSRNGFSEANAFTWTLHFTCGWCMTRAEIHVWQLLHLLWRHRERITQRLNEHAAA